MARKRTSPATKPDDARALRSIEALKRALLELLKTKPFEQILIREIADAAGVSSPTFFRRFSSKDDLLEHIAKDEIRCLLNLGRGALDARNSEQSGETLCAYVNERRTLWKILLTGGAAQVMRSEFLRVAEEMSSTRRRTNPWVPIELATAFTVSGIFEILAWWLRQPDDYPIANVVTLFDALIIDTIARPRNITLTNIVLPAVEPAGAKASTSESKKTASARATTGAKK